MTDKVQKIKDWISKEQDGLMDAQGNFEYPEHEGAYHILCNLDSYIDSLQEEPVSKVWHEASEEPEDKSRCLVMMSEYYDFGGVEYLLYNGNTKEFVSDEYPHPTGNKVEQKSLEGGVVAEVYKNMRDKFPIKGIYKWAYLKDLFYKQEEPVSEELEQAAWQYYDRNKPLMPSELDLHKELIDFFKAGVRWKEQNDSNLSEVLGRDNLDEIAEEYSSCTYLEEVLGEGDREVLKARLKNTFKAGAQWQREKHLSNIDIDAIWGELVCRDVERLTRADVEEFVERLKEGKYDRH